MSPGHALVWPASRRLDVSAGPVMTLTPSNMSSWAFTNDQTNTAGTTTALCALVSGPAGIPNGSVELVTQATTDSIRPPKVTLIPPDSTPLALFTALGSVSGPPLSAGLYRKDIVVVQFHLRTPLAARQAAIDSVGGRVVGGRLYADKTDGYYYVQISGGTTAALVIAVGTLQRQPQVGMAGWWSQFVEPYEAFLRPTDSIARRNRLPDPNALSPGVGGVTTTSDLELTRRTVSLLPPDTVSADLLDSLGSVSGAPLSPGQYRKDVVIVEFEIGTGLSQRQAAIDLVNGVVIGGKLYAEGGDGRYFVRISGGTTAALLNAVGILQRQPGVGKATWWSLTAPDEFALRCANRSRIPLNPPDSIPTALFATLGTVSGPPLLDSAYRKDIVIVSFHPTATQAQRQAAIDSICGWIVGGRRNREGPGGHYFVRITGGTTAALLSALKVLHRQSQVQGASFWMMYDVSMEAFRHPVDKTGSAELATQASTDSIRTSRVTLLPPDSIPTALFELLGSVTGSPPANNPYRKDIVIVAFNRRTPLALRQAAIDSIGGRVVGGHLDTDKTDGSYYVQISGGTNAALVSAVLLLQRLPQVSFAGRWEVFVLPIEASRRPTGETVSTVPPAAPDSIRAALWDSLTQSSNLIFNGPAGKFIRDLLSVKFKPTATPAARQHAIALVKGTVVGGFRLANPEHFYYVRIPYNVAGDSIDGPVLRATHVLEALPSIESATIVGLDFIRLQDRVPFDGAGYDTLLANLTLPAAASRSQRRQLPRPRV